MSLEIFRRLVRPCYKCGIFVQTYYTWYPQGKPTCYECVDCHEGTPGAVTVKSK